MESEKILAMAMFRQSVIQSLLYADDPRFLSERFRELARTIWTLPDGSLRQFAWGTIEDWYYNYKQNGLDGLKDRIRKDSGSFRGLSEKVCEFLDDILEKHPTLRTSSIIEKMKDDGLIVEGKPSSSTIYRYLRIKRPDNIKEVKERRSFEAPYSGHLWQVDIMYGPYLPRKGKDGRWRKEQTFLIAIIDDHSRLLCHGEFYFRQGIIDYLDCLKQALLKRGVPERLYCDNGQVFLASQVKRIMAELGTSVIHTRVRDASAKGKIERLFKTIRSSFLHPLMELEPPKKLKQLNQLFGAWSEVKYNQKEHSAIKMSPIQRWMMTSYKVRLLSVEAENQIFYFETTRRIKKDGTFSFNSVIYETNWVLNGKKATIKYDPFMPERVFVEHDGIHYGRASVLNRNFNHQYHRNTKKDTNNDTQRP